MVPRGRRLGRAAVAISAVIAAAVLTTCSGDAADRAQISAALEASRPITFPNDVGDELAGRLFGPASAAAGVVLAHGLGADQQQWFPFADRLGGEGYRVLTYNARGTCPGGSAGCSEGEASGDEAPSDLRAAIDALRDDGVSRIAVVGSSIGGTAALLVAATDDVDLEAVVSLSAPAQLGELAVGPDVLARVEEAKLFIAGTGDGTAAEDAQTFFDASIQPKRLDILTTDDHGAEILLGNQGEQARNIILTWLASYLGDEGEA
jgi:pimeloyl-ACP methyl ester carboxylesterase